ncbi:hypothetical protein HKX23_16820 [Sulfitobacter sp. KE29]|uniref:hypothetical protein n=1 Tax=Roseobacteraceae TaxID=2854170 RepID=UPI000C45FB94|nr:MULTISPECIES: hypothetical protein [unclassified Sulfitobacter]MAU43751.1 hypothetical protein [Salipiger sp.]MDF3420014.1 hypothetical protein [Sulfitobacter sp. Ks38]MDF3427504.1 hypothetical protein [Sulfitobacter sp. KE29]MDF3431079.1 hypothetical protein [Sulfitobacter sp. S46]MDF3445819.1 hypothetical protein [Sulfitobacter sp. KE31]
MNTKPRLTGEPIMRILCKTSENLVGYLYQWNNGDVQPAWFDRAFADVRYEPFVQAPKENSANPEIPGLRQQGPSHLENA